MTTTTDDLTGLLARLCDDPEPEQALAVLADCLGDLGREADAAWVRTAGVEKPAEPSAIAWRAIAAYVFAELTEPCGWCDGNGGNAPDAMNTWTCKKCHGRGWSPR